MTDYTFPTQVAELILVGLDQVSERGHAEFDILPIWTSSG